jgi:hypothetical protein
MPRSISLDPVQRPVLPGRPLGWYQEKQDSARNIGAAMAILPGKHASMIDGAGRDIRTTTARLCVFVIGLQLLRLGSEARA